MAELDDLSVSLPSSEDEEDLGRGSDAAETSFVAGIDAPLHEAVEEGKVEVVRVQLDALEEEDLKTQLSAKNSNGDTVLHLAAEGDTSEHEEILQVLLDKGGDPNCLDESEQTPLHLAASNGNITMVKMLVDAGADLDKCTDFKETALHQACVGGHTEVVQFLVERGAQVDTTDGFQMSPLHDACSGGYLQVVQILLEKESDITAKDDFGDTSLDNAIEGGHKEIVAELLKGKDWREVLRSYNEEEKTTPFRRMVENMPELAEWVMTQCTETNAGRKHGESIYPDSTEFKVTYDYEFLEDFRDSDETDADLSEKEERGYSSTWGPVGYKKSRHPLFMMAQKDSNKLLSHPLVTSLLDHKWKSFGRYLFFTNLLVYLVFLAFLTSFALLVPKPLDKECVVVFNSTWDGVDPDGCRGSSDNVGRFIYVSGAIIILLAILRLSVEIAQIIILHVHYFLDWVNWLELLLYVFSIIFVSVFRTPCLCVEGWKWQIGVMAVFLGWIVLISFLQKWPLTGLYVLMLVNIFYSFLRIAFLAFLLVVAFGLAFYMLFYDPEAGRTAFSSGGRALVKTMTMTTGEFEFDSIFHQSGDPDEDDIEFPPVSVLLWIIFLVIMPILLNNLLVGLAVGDVEAIQEAANAKRLRLQAELVLSFEELFPKRIRRFFTTRLLEVHPNRPGHLDKFFALLQDDDSLETGEKIARSLSPPTDSVAELKKELEDHLKQQTQELEQQNDKMTAEIKTMKQGIAELNEHSRVLAELIRQIAEKQGVAVDPKTPGV